MSSAIGARFEGPARAGRCLGAGYLAFDGFVLALTRPGRPRMPNGVECDLATTAGQPCRLGAGRLVVGAASVTSGPSWDPVPATRVRLSVDRWFRPRVSRLAGRGGGLTPSGDDLLCGYVAGLVLWGGQRARAERLAERAARRTTLLSATLLRHAARGELPEPAHALLERGDPAPLRGFGHSSGAALLLGLALACTEAGADAEARASRVGAVSAPGSGEPRGR